MHDPTDAQIVVRVLGGDREAFALLVDRHHGRCLRIATHLLGDADAADDIVQDAFVRAYRSLGNYREQDRFGAWLTRIVVNRCRSEQSRAARFAPLDHADEPSVDDRSHALEQRAALAQALATLDPSQREALVLRFADDRSYDEMSAITGVGVSALKMRVQRACARLRTLLTEHLHV
jgi:RNA polymerase sigma-70 factor (ECF subfamily)